jgi:multidrug efflux pump
MRVWLDPKLMKARGVSSQDISEALSSNNYLAALGKTKGQMVSVDLTTNTDLKTEEDFENIIIKQYGTQLVRLRDVATVALGAEDYDELVSFNGQSATFIGIWAFPSANTLDVAAKVREVIPELREGLPSGMKLGIPYDSTRYIQDSINEVLSTLFETVLIVIFVIFLFIGSARGVLVPVVAIPLSLVGAAVFMYVLGFTVNLLTLLAIVLAVGLVVDDAIVMLENVERHIRSGMAPVAAAITAARELVGPTIAMTITLAAVYAPIGLQGGLTGAIFREFAFTLAGAVLVSGFVAITLSPMMSARLLTLQAAPSRFKLATDRIILNLENKYRQILTWLVKHRILTLTTSTVMSCFVVPFYIFSTKELAPKEDQGVLFSIIQAAPNSSLEQTLIYTRKVEEIYESFQERDTTFQIAKPSGGFSGMVLKPSSERSRDVAKIEMEAWNKLSAVPGIRGVVTSPPPLPGGSDFPVELVITSTADPSKLYEFSRQVVDAALRSGRFIFADADLKYDQPESEVLIDREKVASLGLMLKDVVQDISLFTSGNSFNRFSMGGRSYKVIPQAVRTARLNPDQLGELGVRVSDGTLIPLMSVASIEDGVKPRSLERFQQLNSVKIQGVPVPGVSIDQGLSLIEKILSTSLPGGFSIDYAGESRQLRQEGSTLLTTLFMALILIYLVLAAQFESFRDPFIILFGSVPLALFGALSCTFLDLTTINIYSQIGLVTLVGLIAKNGILIVEFSNSLQEKKGCSKVDAAINGAVTRLRPVLMTSIATIVGHCPLIIATGAGSGARNSIGITLVMGMLIGTMFTLFVVPTIYTVIAKPHERG